MSKVAIMTWFHHSNFGTALQVTALTEIINKLGYDVDVLNYIPSGIQIEKIDSTPKYILEKLSKKINNHKNPLYFSSKKEEAFVEYRNVKINVTKKCQTMSALSNISDKYDAIVCGSDQIWTPLHFDSHFFLDFADSHKIISYAPSIGVNEITDKGIEEQMRHLISRFKYLSIREQQGQKIIKEISGKDSTVVLDPTMLLTANEWDNILGLDDVHDGDYVFCYFLGRNEKYWKKIKSYALRHSLKIVIVPVYQKDLRRGHEIKDGIGPKEFVELIKSAKMVFTDSFHGIVFSIIYEKSFVAFERFKSFDVSSQNSRIYNILNKFGLGDRLFNGKAFQTEKIDYFPIQLKLENERSKSVGFLSNALESVVNSSQKDVFCITKICSGCGVCESICPTKAISIEINSFGFYESHIDKQLCIECKKCTTVCPSCDNNALSVKESKVYMYKSRSMKTLATSSSGGFSNDFAKIMIEDSWSVSGCMYNYSNNKAEHIVIDSTNELREIQGSKYLPSDFGKIVKLLIEKNKAVIFGLPCQIAGMDRRLRHLGLRENYILIDLICHGVPSYLVWDKFRTENFENFKQIKFRDKCSGWQNKTLSYCRTTGEKVVCDETNLFYKYFNLGHCYNNACYQCDFRDSSAADIRIGDFWGERFSNDYTGVSIILGLTEKGKEIMENTKLSKVGEVKEYDVSDYWNVQQTENFSKPIFYEEMLEDLTFMKLDEVFEKYEKGIYNVKRLTKLYKKIRKL